MSENQFKDIDDDSYMNVYRDLDEIKLDFDRQNMNIKLHDEKEQLLLIYDEQYDRHLIIFYCDKDNRIVTEVDEYI